MCFEAALNQSRTTEIIAAARILCNNVLCCVNLPRIVLEILMLALRKLTETLVSLRCAERVFHTRII